MCEIYGFCGNRKLNLNKYTDVFWSHSNVHKDGFGYYLADKNELYVNPNSASNYLIKLARKQFDSNLALCHIRYKTHGDAKTENCHPFTKYDCYGIKWTLIHNGFIYDTPELEALQKFQVGETDSERILLYIIESINKFYEHSYIESKNDFLQYLYMYIEDAINQLSCLGRVNLIFTDNYTNNMYVFMNQYNTLYYLKTDNGFHFSTTKLSNEDWKPVTPNKLFVINNGKQVKY